MIVPPPDASAWVDGRRIHAGDARLPAFDGGVLSGMGVFETLAVRDGRPVELERHLARMAAGACALGMELPERERLRAIAAEAAGSASGSGCGWLRIVVTSGGHWIVTSGAMDPREEGRPATAVVLRWRRNPFDPLVRFKTLARAANIVGLREARRRDADEGLWLNVRGHLAEGCTSNVFVVSGRALFTPSDREGILPGIIRERVLAAGRNLGLPVHEGRVRCRRLLRAEEAFLSSSLRGIRPLVRIDGRPVGPGVPGRVTGRIADEVARLRGLAPPGAGQA